VIRGISYYAMSIIIDDLAAQMDGSKPVPIPVPVPIAPIAAPEADMENTKPNINFYLAPEEADQKAAGTKPVAAPTPVDNDAQATIDEKDGSEKKPRERRPRERRPKASPSSSSAGQGAQPETETSTDAVESSQSNDLKKRHRHRSGKVNHTDAGEVPDAGGEVLVSAPAIEMAPPTLAPSTNVWTARAQAQAAASSSGAPSTAAVATNPTSSNSNPKPRRDRPYPPRTPADGSNAPAAGPGGGRPTQPHGGRGSRPVDGHNNAANPNPRPRRPQGDGPRPPRAAQAMSAAQAV
jgi:hypothetical protein